MATGKFYMTQGAGVTLLLDSAVLGRADPHACALTHVDTGPFPSQHPAQLLPHSKGLNKHLLSE